MHILMVAATPYFSDRGCHVRIQGETVALERRGHEVTIATYGLGADVPGGRILRTRPLTGYTRVDAAPTTGKLRLDAALLLTTLRLTRERRPDILHGHTQEGGMLAIVVSRLTGIPVVVDLQSRRVAEELVAYGVDRDDGPLFRLANAFDHAIPRWADDVVTSTQAIAELVADAQVNRTVQVVADAVDFLPALMERDAALAHSLGIDLQRPVIAYLGLLTETQGIDLLLDAMCELKHHTPRPQLLIMGYPDIERWRQSARAMGLDGIVSFPGRIPFSDAPRYLALANAAVSAKRTLVEGNGKLLLYMSCGLPTVALDTATNRQVLGPDGLYSPDDPVEFAATMARSLSVDEAWRGPALRIRAEQEASWDTRAAQLEQIYLKLVCERVTKPA